MPFDKNLFKKTMRSKGITQQQLTEKLGVEYRTINRWLSSKVKAPSVERLQQLCDAIQEDPTLFDPEWIGPVTGDSMRVGARVSVAAKNGYKMMKDIWGVSEKDIIEIAPVLFAIVASKTVDHHFEANRVKLEDFEEFADEHGYYPMGPTATDRFNKIAGILNDRRLFGEDPYATDDPNEDEYHDMDYIRTGNPFNETLQRLAAKTSDVSVPKSASGVCPTSWGVAFSKSLSNAITDNSINLNGAIARGEISLLDEEYLQVEFQKDARLKWLKKQYEPIDAGIKEQAKRDQERRERNPILAKFWDERETPEVIEKRKLDAHEFWGITPET